MAVQRSPARPDIRYGFFGGGLLLECPVGIDVMPADVLVVASGRVGLAVLLALACFTDWRFRRIPNFVSVGALVGGLLWHGLAPAGSGLFDPYMAGSLGLRDASIGAVLILVLLIPAYALGLVGAGDVKLAAAVGAWVGAVAVPGLLLMIAASGGVLAVVWAIKSGDLIAMLWRSLSLAHRLVRRVIGLPVMHEASRDGSHLEGPIDLRQRLPFALAIAGGCISYGVATNQLLIA